MAKSRPYVRQMPKIYGNLQKPVRSYERLFSRIKVVFWCVFVAGLVYTIFFSGFFSIKSVVVEGNRFSTPEMIKGHIPLGANIFRFSKEESISQIVQDVSIDSVRIYRGVPDSIKVVVTERQPALRWVTGTTMVIIDKKGIPFLQYSTSQLPTPESDAGKVLAAIPLITDTKAVPVTLERGLISVSFINFISSLGPLLTTYTPSQTLDHMEIADTTSDLTYITKQGLRIEFNTLGDSGVQVRNLTRLIQQKKVTATSRVDLRIDRWAYVTQ